MLLLVHVRIAIATSRCLSDGRTFHEHVLIFLMLFNTALCLCPFLSVFVFLM